LADLMHSRREFLRRSGAAGIALGVPSWLTTCASGTKARLPNVVLIFTDDQGYADVGVDQLIYAAGSEAVRPPIPGITTSVSSSEIRPSFASAIVRASAPPPALRTS